MSGAHRRWLTSDRSLPCDIVHFAGMVPLTRAEMSIDLSGVALQRSSTVTRISWAAVFLKAYGCVSNRNPLLRQCYMRWPLPHVYQHDESVAMLTIQREYAGKPRLCWGRWIDPGKMSLADIQQRLDHYQHEPVDKVFSKQLRMSNYPRFFRRMVWWTTLNVFGCTRARQVGTFSISSLAGQDVNNRDHPTICTTSLSYGALDRFGHSLVTLVYDHRLMDGMQAAESLQQLRACLQREIFEELSQYRRTVAA